MEIAVGAEEMMTSRSSRDLHPEHAMYVKLAILIGNVAQCIHLMAFVVLYNFLRCNLARIFAVSPHIVGYPQVFTVLNGFIDLLQC